MARMAPQGSRERERVMVAIRRLSDAPELPLPEDRLAIVPPARHRMAHHVAGTNLEVLYAVKGNVILLTHVVPVGA